MFSGSCITPHLFMRNEYAAAVQKYAAKIVKNPPPVKFRGKKTFFRQYNAKVYTSCTFQPQNRANRGAEIRTFLFI